MAGLMLFAGWFHYHKRAPKLEWFQNVESMMEPPPWPGCSVWGLPELGWSPDPRLPSHQQDLLDAGVAPQDIPLPPRVHLEQPSLIGLTCTPSFAEGSAALFTLN